MQRALISTVGLVTQIKHTIWAFGVDCYVYGDGPRATPLRYEHHFLLLFLDFQTYLKPRSRIHFIITLKSSIFLKII